jgi:hypothetical protein
VNDWWKLPADGHGPEPRWVACCSILTFESLSPIERAAWKGLLDYYVFDEADAAAHIPAERRDMLGTLAPEMAAKLREAIPPLSVSTPRNRS